MTKVSNARAAKKAADDKRERELAANKQRHHESIEGQAETIMTQVGKSTEDIFAVITKEGVPTFSRIFANSVEAALVNALQSPRFQDIMAAIVQDQLSQAYRGILKGLQPQTIEIPTNNIVELFTGRIGDFSETDNATIDAVNAVLNQSSQAAVTVTKEELVLEETDDKLGNDPVIDPTRKRGEILYKAWGDKAPRINWKGMEDAGIHRTEIVFWILEELEEQDVDINIGLHVTNNASSRVYQQGIDFYGTWADAIEAYRIWKAK